MKESSVKPKLKQQPTKRKRFWFGTWRRDYSSNRYSVKWETKERYQRRKKSCAPKWETSDDEKTAIERFSLFKSESLSISISKNKKMKFFVRSIFSYLSFFASDRVSTDRLLLLLRKEKNYWCFMTFLKSERVFERWRKKKSLNLKNGF